MHNLNVFSYESKYSKFIAIWNFKHQNKFEYINVVPLFAHFILVDRVIVILGFTLGFFFTSDPSQKTKENKQKTKQNKNKQK